MWLYKVKKGQMYKNDPRDSPPSGILGYCYYI